MAYSIPNLEELLSNIPSQWASDLDIPSAWKNLFDLCPSEAQLLEDTTLSWSDDFESAKGLAPSLQQSSPSPLSSLTSRLSSQSIGSADSSPSYLSNYSTASLSSSLKCDRCSAKKIRCSHTFPCARCIADGVECTVSFSRRHHPGTCNECFRRKIPCVGSGAVCYGCKLHKTPHLCHPVPRRSTSNSISDDNNSSRDPSKKKGRGFSRPTGSGIAAR